MTAVAILEMAAGRELLPTHLSTEGIRGGIAAAIRERSLFVARGTSLGFLTDLAAVLDEFLAGRMNDGTARMKLLESLERWEYSPEMGFPHEGGDVPPAEPGSLRDLSSRSRLQLILDTQAGLMFGAGQKAAGEGGSSAYRFPAWELIRTQHREVPRGFRGTKAGLVPVRGESWPERWVAAGAELVADRMIAMKGAPIWAALGDSEVFSDGLDVDHPPFAFNSGMGWRPVRRSVCLELGLIPEDWEPEGFAEWRLNESAKVGARNIPADLVAAARRELQADLEGSALRVRAERDARFATLGQNRTSFLDDVLAEKERAMAEREGRRS